MTTTATKRLTWAPETPEDLIRVENGATFEVVDRDFPGEPTLASVLNVQI
ncbi:hypothetical protein Pla22_17440 [Rubripirellula amarantea]|uniref:Uncharacterized protein n=1 Tax=Rubripirellula amarantea TaxID=2527999 RepID=A0A5C5WV24_9BACT|nr:hypothetical protein Pla22_17440 [Rubripirellula amarantea]